MNKAAKARSRVIKRALKYEKNKAKEYGCTHHGGPGKPDYICPDGTIGEVKRRKTKVTKSELMRYAQKGVTRIHSSSGFTKQAIAYRDRYRNKITLCKRNTCI